ncbi:MAG: glutamyl-tRNA reductase [Candidatus Zixiibacteriota bacterium]
MEFGVIGTSIWQQNMPLIESLTVDRENKSAILQNLKDKLKLDELIYLATCNRVEFYYISSRSDNDSRMLHRLIDFFFSGKKNISFFPNDFYHFSGKEAISHLFRTVSSLESLVIGENQIAGQIKDAHKEALESGLAGIKLDHLICEALMVARKVKSQTSIGVGAVSMASLAFNELVESAGELNHPKVAIVGTGKMQVKLARMISNKYNAEIIFANRTVQKAQILADEFGGTAIELSNFIENPGEVDIIISATASVDQIFDKNFHGKILKNGKRVICLDMAIPRDFSSAFDNGDNIELIDISYLKSKGQKNLRQKFVEAGKANDIVRLAVNKYLTDRIELSLKPIFRQSYNESIEMAEKALDELFSKRITRLDENEREAILRTVTRLIGHTAFSPVKHLSSQMVEKRAEVDLESLDSSIKKAI